MKTELNTSQADAFCKRVKPMLRFLYLCRRRLDTLGFDRKSCLYAAVDQAYSAVHRLHVELHYGSIGHGVGHPLKEE
jgi:hypothetical protein